MRSAAAHAHARSACCGRRQPRLQPVGRQRRRPCCIVSHTDLLSPAAARSLVRCAASRRARSARGRSQRLQQVRHLALTLCAAQRHQPAQQAARHTRIRSLCARMPATAAAAVAAAAAASVITAAAPGRRRGQSHDQRLQRRRPRVACPNPAGDVAEVSAPVGRDHRHERQLAKRGGGQACGDAGVCGCGREGPRRLAPGQRGPRRRRPCPPGPALQRGVGRWQDLAGRARARTCRDVAATPGGSEANSAHVAAHVPAAPGSSGNSASSCSARAAHTLSFGGHNIVW